MKVQVKVAIGSLKSNKIEAWFCHHASTSFGKETGHQYTEIVLSFV